MLNQTPFGTESRTTFAPTTPVCGAQEVHCRAVACPNHCEPTKNTIRRRPPSGRPTLNQTNQETHLRVLRQIEANPSITQRELAQLLGVSLGKVNYCLKALIDRGWIKVNNFKNSHNKASYAYLLTPSGIEEKAKITVRFLKQRIQDYEQIKREIAELESEVNGQSAARRNDF